MVSPKQDRVKARTVEDLERKHNFRQMGANSSDSLRSATEARESATEAKEAANKAEASVANKVGKDEYDEIVKMLNLSTLKVILENRLVVKSDNFSINEEGDVTMKSADTKGYGYSVSVDDGILTVDSPSTIQAEGTQQIVELMRFHISGQPYRLCMLVVFTIDDPSYPDGKWVLGNQFIEPVEEEQE